MPAALRRQEDTPPAPGHTGVPVACLPDLPELPDAAWPASARCPVRDVLDRVGDTWSVLVVLRLGHAGTLRFRELLRAVDGISQRMLTVTLRALERDGLVVRTVHAQRPVAVDYALTPLGASLMQPIAALAGWAMAHEAPVREARERFDAREAGAVPTPGLHRHRIA